MNSYFMRLVKMAKPYWGMIAMSGLAMLGMTGLNLVTPALVQDFIGKLDSPQGVMMNQLYIYAVILIGAYLLRAVCRFLQNYLSHKAAWTLVPNVRVTMYDHLQRLSMGYFQDKQTGNLMSRLVNDSDRIESLIAHCLPECVTNTLLFICITTILMMQNPTLTLLTFIPVPFLLVGGIIFNKKIRPIHRRAQQALGDFNSLLQDNLSGMKEIQVFNQQDTERGHIKEKSFTWANLLIKALRNNAIFHPTIEFFISLGTVVVVVFGGMLAIRDSLTTAQIVGFLMYLSLFYQPIAGLANLIEQLQQGYAGAIRVFEILDAEPDIKDKPDAIDMPVGEGAVRFEDVSFHYQEDMPVLSHIDIEAKPGEMVALVGPTGVGKTTIINLLSRFYDPVSGRVTLDGQDLRDITLRSLRENIAIVLQDVFLFNDTVAANIAYGRKDATREQIIAAARIAHADGFIDAMPDGYDTYIGERGVRLSGGQKQRLAIARAVLCESPVLILDEATASVDVETEAEIQAAIQALAGTRTIIVIAHRLSTVKQADKIIVLEEGKVVERGTHEQLLHAGGLYSRLCKVQLEATLDSAAALLPTGN